MILLVECHAIEQPVPSTIFLRSDSDIERSDSVHCENGLFWSRLRLNHCQCTQDDKRDENGSEMLSHVTARGCQARRAFHPQSTASAHRLSAQPHSPLPTPDPAASQHPQLSPLLDRYADSESVSAHPSSPRQRPRPK